MTGRGLRRIRRRLGLSQVELAKRLGITLIGYVRRDKFNVYSHPENLASRMEAVVERARNGVSST